MADMASAFMMDDDQSDVRPPRRWWLTAFAGALVVALATSTMAWFDWGAVGIMSALGLGTGIFAFPIGRRLYVSFGTAVLLAALGLFGLKVAVWVALLTGVTLEGLVFHRGWRETARDVGMEILALGAAGITYRLLGGRTPPGGMQIIDVGRFAVSFFAFSAVASVFSRATDDSERNPLLRYVRWMAGKGVVIELAMFPLALLLIASYAPGDQATFPLLAVVLMVSSAAGRTIWETARSLMTRLGELKLLNATGQALASAVRSEDIVLALRDHLRPMVDIGALSVTFDEDDGSESLVVFDDERRIVLLREVGDCGNLVSEVLRTGATQVVADVSSDRTAKLPDSLVEELERRSMKPGAWIGVPLFVAERRVGALSVLALAPGAFRPTDGELYGTIASQVARALEKAHLYERLEASRERVARWNRALERRVTLRTRELEEARSELESLNADLEHRVAERTRELESMQERIIESGKLAAVGELAAGVAHELNSPLGGILGYTQFDLERLRAHSGEGLDADATGKVAEHLSYIERETQRCKAIVEGLVKFAQTSGRAVHLVGLNGIVRTAIEFTASQLAMRGIHLETVLDERIPRISADSVELQQVFANIILNARDAMPEGGRLIVRTAETRMPDGSGGVAVSFTDTGCGISKENLVRVFEPFFTTRGLGSGTGLGLSVSYGIIREHGGDISVRSDVGIGSTFTVRLPVAGPPGMPGGPSAGESVLETGVVQ